MKTSPLLLALLAACNDGSFAPSGSRSFVPPTIYAKWWSEVEACADRAGDWQRIAWFATPDITIPYHDIGATAVWSAPHTIYLAAQIADTTWTIVTNPGHGTPTEYRRFIVQHEMLHDLLQSGAHGPIFDRCHLQAF